MKRLSYTEEMLRQDLLWKDEDEDIEVMEELFKEIVKEAESLGFTGIVDIYQATDEAIADVYESQEEKDDAEMSGNETTCYGFCKPLISHLEKILNK